MLLREGREIQKPVCFGDLADALVNPDAPPNLVTLNLYYSGARIARELVGTGGPRRARIPRRDRRRARGAVLPGVLLGVVRPGEEGPFPRPSSRLAESDGDGLHGTAIVIWMGPSVFEELPAPPRPGRPTPETSRDVKRNMARCPSPSCFKSRSTSTTKSIIAAAQRSAAVPQVDVDQAGEGPLEDIACTSS